MNYNNNNCGNNFNQNGFPMMNPMMPQMMMNPMMQQMMMNPMMQQMMMNPMMMQQMMNIMGGNNINVNINSNNPNDWNLIFEKKNGSQTINIRISPDETVQAAINLYKIRTNTQEKDDEIKFIFNGKQLNYDLKLSQSGLMNGSKITVISTKDVEGAF